MSIKVANSRLIRSSFMKWDKLYQHLVSNIDDFQRVGTQLVWEAQTAQALRQISKLAEIGAILTHSPIREYRLIGQYYLGWCAYRTGKDSRATFEKVIENSTAYRSMALIDMATLELSAGKCDLGVKFCVEAIQQSNSISTILNATRSITVIKSSEGFHALALKDLEAIAPLTRYASPIARYQYLNSLAVELGEAGRVEEAQNVCKVVLASPFAIAYPEWRETGREIAFRGYKSRSAVSVIKPASENVVQLPVPDTNSLPVQTKPARILNYVEFKKKMGKEPNGEEELPKNMEQKDMVLKLLNLVTQDDATEQEVLEVLEYALKVFSRK